MDRVSNMALPPPVYELFPLSSSVAQNNMDALVSVLWWTLFPELHFGQNYRLNTVFTRMYLTPDKAALYLCPYYFDQVTFRLPARDPVSHMESCNLRLQCMHSWADLKQERQRASERRRKRDLKRKREIRPNAGIYLSGLCQLRHPNTGRSLSNKEYIYLMYGYRS